MWWMWWISLHPLYRKSSIERNLENPPHPPHPPRARCSNQMVESIARDGRLSKVTNGARLPLSYCGIWAPRPGAERERRRPPELWDAPHPFVVASCRLATLGTAVERL